MKENLVSYILNLGKRGPQRAKEKEVPEDQNDRRFLERRRYLPEFVCLSAPSSSGPAIDL